MKLVTRLYVFYLYNFLLLQMSTFLFVVAEDRNVRFGTRGPVDLIPEWPSRFVLVDGVKCPVPVGH